VIVRLSREGDRSLLRIDDDGVGIGAIDKPLEGLGLRNMRYRAQVIGGTLDVTSTASGTSVLCSWSE
jgi:signal transduction histidine kinase